MKWQCESLDIDTNKRCGSPAKYKITKASPYATPMYKCEDCAQYYLRMKGTYNIEDIGQSAVDNPGRERGTAVYNPRYQGIGPDDFNVSFTANEIREFKKKWPVSGLTEKPVTFRFDRKGDLVDMFPTDWGKDADGAAVSALAEDAKKYAMSRRQDNPYKFGRNRLRYRMPGVMDNPYKFPPRVTIRSATPEESEGKWDWFVRVRHGGKELVEMASGGRETAEAVARRLSRELDLRSNSPRSSLGGSQIDWVMALAVGDIITDDDTGEQWEVESKWRGGVGRSSGIRSKSKKTGGVVSMSKIDMAKHMTGPKTFRLITEGSMMPKVRSIEEIPEWLRHKNPDRPKGWKHIGGGCEAGKSGFCCDDEYLSGHGTRAIFSTTKGAHFSMPSRVMDLSELTRMPGVKLQKKVREEEMKDNPRSCESCNIGSVYREGLCIQCYYGKDDNPRKDSSTDDKEVMELLAEAGYSHSDDFGEMEHRILSAARRAVELRPGLYKLKQAIEYVGDRSDRLNKVKSVARRLYMKSYMGHVKAKGELPTFDNPRTPNQRHTGPSLTKEYESEASRAEYHHVRLTEPKGYLRYRWIDLSRKQGIKGLVAVRPASAKGKRGGRTEFQKLGFRKDLWRPREIDAWLRKHGYGRLKNA